MKHTKSTAKDTAPHLAPAGRRLDFFTDMDLPKNEYKLHQLAGHLMMEDRWILDAFLMIAETFKGYTEIADNFEAITRVEEFANNLQDALFLKTWEADQCKQAYIDYLKKGERDYATDQTGIVTEQSLLSIADSLNNEAEKYEGYAKDGQEVQDAAIH